MNFSGNLTKKTLKALLAACTSAFTAQVVTARIFSLNLAASLASFAAAFGTAFIAAPTLIAAPIIWLIGRRQRARVLTGRKSSIQSVGLEEKDTLSGEETRRELVGVNSGINLTGRL